MKCIIEDIGLTRVPGVQFFDDYIRYTVAA